MTESGASLPSRIGSFARTVFRAVHLWAWRAKDLEQRLDDQARSLQVWTFMDWITRVTVPAGPLVSVVLPTRDRCDLLPRAIASVTGQTYANWELIIVDDGSVDATPEFLAHVEDKRIRHYRSEGRGVCAARNVALAQAGGEIIVYLDDDNLMHPNWLKSVVWTFTQRPEANVLYGAFVVDNPARIRKKGELPELYFCAYDHQAVATSNIADISCIAHRAGLAEAHFDESLREMGDWDMFLRLTRHAPPVALPAIGCYYTTDAPNRLSHGATHAADKTLVRARNRR